MSPTYEFGPFRLDTHERLLLRAGQPVALTPKAFDTLVVLVERQGRVVTKDELLSLVWPDVFIEEATLTQNVYTLRKTLADGEEDSLFIQTVPRRGYRFAAAVTRLGESPSPPAPAAGSPPTEGGAHSAMRRIAVLPFAALGAEDDREFLGLGMADALITRLSTVRSLTVRPTSAVLRHLGAAPDPLAVGRELGVDGVLEGTAQRSDLRVRTTVRLVSMADGTTLWAGKFDVVASDIFALQDAISERVTEALQLELTGSERRRLTQRATASTEAYQAYVRGRYFWERRTEEALRRAITYFRQALDEDPLFAQGYAGLADSYVLLPLYGTTPPREAFPQAQQAARRALELDDGLAEAHTSLAYTRFFYDWDWPAAEEGFRRALAANPGYATTHHWYSFFLAARARPDEALDRAVKAQQLDPLSLVINTDLAFVLYFARRYEEAIDQLRRTLELEGSFAYAHVARALAFTELGQDRAAVAAGRQAVSLAPASGFGLATLGFALARAGAVGEAEEILGELTGRAARHHVQATYRAMVLAALGRNDEALGELELAVFERSHFVAFFNVWPVFDRLRAEPRFRALLASTDSATPSVSAASS